MIELLVVIAISTVLMSVVMFGYSVFNQRLSVSGSAQEIVLAARQAQSYGLNVRESGAGLQDFASPFGVYFNPTDSSDAYYIFVDKNGDGRYSDALGNCSGSECVQKIDLRNGVRITTLSKSGSSCPSAARTLEVMFKRPNPDAIINFRNSAGVIICAPSSSFMQDAKITILSSNDSESKEIGFDATGQVYIQ